MNDYLWDGSGEPDAEIQHLETLLSQFQSRQPAPDWPREKRIAFPWFGLESWWARMIPAFALAILVIASLLLIRHRATPPVAGPSWQVSSVKGSPLLGAVPLRGKGLLAVGEQFETDSQSQATLNISSVGEVRIEPDTRLHIIQSSARRQFLALDRGTIRTMIWAAPGQFVIRTPSVTAVDLGCAYTLHVDANGAGLIKVTFGWVAFRQDGRESFIPEGAACATRPGIGPGTPYVEDAPNSLRDALAAFDFGNPTMRGKALHTVLASVRPRDALTLWHLLSRTSGAERIAVYDRLALFAPPPPGVTRQGILAGDSDMRDLWWNRLDYGNMSWWRIWERDWTNPAR